MKLSEVDCSEFIAMLREQLGLNTLISLKDACNQYNITIDHLNYQIRTGRISTVHKRGKAFVARCDMERLMQCNLLIHKHKQNNSAKD